MTALTSTASILSFDTPFFSLQRFPTVSKASKSYSLYQKPSIRLNYRLIGILYPFIESKYIGPRTFFHTSYMIFDKWQLVNCDK